MKIGTRFIGFDGMVLTNKGTVIGVTNNRTSLGGNTLIELTSKDDWSTADIVNSKSINPSTTVAITPDNENYVIYQDFSPESAASENWTIERIDF